VISCIINPGECSPSAPRIGHGRILLAGGTLENKACPKDQGPMASLFDHLLQFLPLWLRDDQRMFLGPATSFFGGHTDIIQQPSIYTSYF
jgi:hypothetical protein